MDSKKGKTIANTKTKSKTNIKPALNNDQAKTDILKCGTAYNEDEHKWIAMEQSKITICFIHGAYSSSNKYVKLMK